MFRLKYRSFNFLHRPKGHSRNKSLKSKAYSHETTVECINKAFEAIGGMHLRLWIAVDQNKYNLASFTTTNLSMVGKDLRVARSLEGVMFQPKTGQMLKVIGWRHNSCGNVHSVQTR
jgi:hypothetical protein